MPSGNPVAGAPVEVEAQGCLLATLFSAAAGNGVAAQTVDGYNGTQYLELNNAAGTGGCTVSVQGSFDRSTWYGVGYYPAIDSSTSATRTLGNISVGAGAAHVYQLLDSYPYLQVTISEVRPDGNETFVQTGWLRTSGRKLDPRQSTLLAPYPSFRRADAAPLPKGRWAQVIVPLYYEGHAYRRGSRIRVTITAPGGDQPVWSFAETDPLGSARVSLAYSPQMPSRLILPVVPGIRIPTLLPPCGSLRGEPCRRYRPLANGSA